MNEEIEIRKELRQIEMDKKQFERELKQQNYVYAQLLLSEMGKDINDVLSGKVKVTLTWKEKLKYTFRYIKNKFSKIFKKNG